MSISSNVAGCARACAASRCICSTSASSDREASPRRAASPRTPLRSRARTGRRRNRTRAPRAAASCRPPSGACRGSPPRAARRAVAGAVHAHGEDARDRRRAPLEPQVRGRESRASAPSCSPGTHPAAHRLGPPQRALRAGEVAAASAARTALLLMRSPAGLHRRHDVHREPQAPPGRGAAASAVACAVAAEAEVVAHDHDAGARAPAPAAARTPRPRGYAMPRRSAAGTGNPAAARRGSASARAARSAAPADPAAARYSRGSGSKVNSTAGSPARRRVLGQARDERLVTQVQAVERADGQ